MYMSVSAIVSWSTLPCVDPRTCYLCVCIYVCVYLCVCVYTCTYTYVLTVDSSVFSCCLQRAGRRLEYGARDGIGRTHQHNICVDPQQNVLIHTKCGLIHNKCVLIHSHFVLIHNLFVLIHKILARGAPYNSPMEPASLRGPYGRLLETMGDLSTGDHGSLREAVGDHGRSREQC